ncbi:MAG: ribosome recycling factor [Dissulfurimicrobium sp.]|uniref:ribosome recycling factor n=1 Tax=Dissulfurimicrobium hydrothermale TaxID=1750598 RepID=UPI001EDBE256|nr:ribosome recycling factor [Dissulfurimicrobium hydrothermale]UKL14385.1 ribosome recycling factor [Dissulfurimicrobium hydrothermale]
MHDAVIKDTKSRMDKAIESFQKELARIRTGRAAPALLEGIKVDYYGTLMPINQLATIAAPESRLLTIQPWDNAVLGLIEKAILKSDLGLTPNSDGKMIRINIPPLNEQRRKDLVKMVKKMAEECKVAIRNIRRDMIERLKAQKKDKGLSEDDFFKLQDEIQKITDGHVKKVEDILALKEKEVLEF